MHRAAGYASLVLVIPSYRNTITVPPTEQTRTDAVDMGYSSQTKFDVSAVRAPKRAGYRAVYKLVRTSRLYEQIVGQIEKSIVKGDLKPGDQLPAERELAVQFGVSRTAVREAVKALREKGLVEAYSGRGTFITDGTSQAVRQSLDLMVKIGQAEGSNHLAEVRAILEPEIAGLAATRIQEPELATMREAVAVMDGAGQDPDTYIEADLDFHLALAEGAANPLILSLLDSIVGLLREHRLRIFRVPGGPERGQVFHKRILDAVERRDADKARQAMREHLNQVRDDGQASPAKKTPGKQSAH